LNLTAKSGDLQGKSLLVGFLVVGGVKDRRKRAGGGVRAGVNILVGGAYYGEMRRVGGKILGKFKFFR
jgi:hypothetical protein